MVHSIQIFDELPSTNTYILDNLDLLSDNTVIIAELQTNGRGRRENSWISQKSIGLTLSLLKVFPLNINISSLPLVIALAIIRTLNDFALQAKIKWPNDILKLDASKIAGVLIENRVNLKHNRVVIGIGINDTFGVERYQFCAQLLEHLDNIIEVFINKGFLYLKEEWQSHCIHYNKMVGIYQENKFIQSGINIGVNNMGELLVKNTAGNVHNYNNASLRFEITNTFTTVG